MLLRGDAGEVIVGDLDQEFAEALAAGTSLRTARRRYWRQTLASIVATQRGARETDTVTTRTPFRPLRGLSLDFRSILRTLRASPGYVFVAVLSLAIGIGANTAVFSMVRQLLLEPLPVDRPDELRLLYWTQNSNDPVKIRNLISSGYRDPSGVNYRSNFSYAEYTAMRTAVSGSAILCGFNLAPNLTISIEGRPPIVANGMLVSGSFSATVRPPLVLGRGLTDSDDIPGAPAVAVIGYGLWTRLLGNDPSVLGRTIRLSDAPVTIVGVTAPAYRGLSQGGFIPETDVTVALSQQPLVTPRWADPGESLFTASNLNWVRAIARVQDGADAAITDVLRTTLRGALTNGGLTAAEAAISSPRLFPGARGLDSLRTSAALPLRVLSVVVGVVLLIACINIAGLMLARGVARQRELVVRRALGAGRARIMRQLLLESVILSVAGGAAGLLLALLTAPVLQSMLASGLGTSGVGVTLDWPLLAVTATLACAAGVLAGLLPAIRFSRHGDTMLRARSIAAPKLTIGRALLVLQIAVSLPLVVGAGLFLRTIHNLASLDLGFNPRGLVLFSARSDDERQGARPIGDRLSATARAPGADSRRHVGVAGRKRPDFRLAVGFERHDQGPDGRPVHERRRTALPRDDGGAAPERAIDCARRSLRASGGRRHQPERRAAVLRRRFADRPALSGRPARRGGRGCDGRHEVQRPPQRRAADDAPVVPAAPDGIDERRRPRRGAGGDTASGDRARGARRRPGAADQRVSRRRRSRSIRRLARSASSRGC